jgi:hypothetical protein
MKPPNVKGSHTLKPPSRALEALISNLQQMLLHGTVYKQDGKVLGGGV